MSVTSVTIRAAALEDLLSLSNLFNRYLNFQGLKYNYADSIIFMEKRLTQSDSKIFVVESNTDKKIVAFAQLYPNINSFTQKKVWHFSDIWVDDQYRRLGIARQLVKACEDFSSSSGSQGMVLKVENENNHALALCESMGWKKETLTLFRLNHDHDYNTGVDLPF